MKYLLQYCCIILPWFAVAQECAIHSETDPFTKQTRLTTGFLQLKNATLSIQADKVEIDFFFVIAGKDKCYSDGAIAQVFFEGSKMKTTLRNSGSMNCDGYFHFIFKNQETPHSALKRMATQKITHILFTGNDKKETQVTLTPEQQEKLMHYVSCMIGEALLLLPPKN